MYLHSYHFEIKEDFSVFYENHCLGTLESGIVVPVRLLNFENFSHQYFLIPASTFIGLQINKDK